MDANWSASFAPEALLIRSLGAPADRLQHDARYVTLIVIFECMRFVCIVWSIRKANLQSAIKSVFIIQSLRLALCCRFICSFFPSSFTSSSFIKRQAHVLAIIGTEKKPIYFTSAGSYTRNQKTAINWNTTHTHTSRPHSGIWIPISRVARTLEHNCLLLYSERTIHTNIHTYIHYIIWCTCFAHAAHFLGVVETGIISTACITCVIHEKHT